MEEKEYRKIMITIIVLILLALTILILRPIAIAIFFGLILSYIFHPLYLKLYKKIKSKNLSAFIILLLFLLIVIIPVILLFPIVMKQLLDAYVAFKAADLSPALRNLVPVLFENPKTAADVTAMITKFTANIADFFLATFQRLLVNLPSILLQTAIVLFTFFFAVREQEAIKDYVVSISPFPKEYQKKFYQKFEEVTQSVLFGQIVVGIAQGLVAGIGYFIFRVPNALLLTLITTLVGVIPIIGPWLVWIPIDIYLFLSENTGPAIGLLIYGLLVINWIDTLIRPQIVSRKTKMNSAVALIGMVGGLYVFGVLGLIIGPLILAYLFLLIEFSKERRFKSMIFEEEKDNSEGYKGLYLIHGKK